MIYIFFSFLFLFKVELINKGIGPMEEEVRNYLFIFFGHLKALVPYQFI